MELRLLKPDSLSLIFIAFIIIGEGIFHRSLVTANIEFDSTRILSKSFEQKLSGFSSDKKDKGGASADGKRGHTDDSWGPWRWCFICSGTYPDRECELSPSRVTAGPGKMNCTRKYCSTHVRYEPALHLLQHSDQGPRVPKRVLTPDDFKVVSIARGCEDRDRGNTCIVDHDLLGATCFDTCSTDFCNGYLRRPQWKHFIESNHEANSPRSTADFIKEYIERTGLGKEAERNQNEAVGYRSFAKSLDLYNGSRDTSETITEHDTYENREENHKLINKSPEKDTGSERNQKIALDRRSQRESKAYTDASFVANERLSVSERSLNENLSANKGHRLSIESSFENLENDVTESAKEEETFRHSGGILLELRGRRSDSEISETEDEYNLTSMSLTQSGLSPPPEKKQASSSAANSNPTILTPGLLLIFSSLTISYFVPC